VSGDLRIVASADLGDLGPTDGKPVLYYFSPLYHAQGFIPWLLLPLPFIALKENRTAQAAWILAPVVLLSVVFWGVMTVLKPASGDAVQMSGLFRILLFGFSMIWLCADRIGNRGRLIAFALGALVYFGFLGANLLTSDLGKDAGTTASIAAMAILPVLLAFAAASLFSSRSFGRVRFLAVAGVALFVSFAIILLAVTVLFDPRGSIQSQISQVAFASLFFSLAFLVGLTPFLALMWTNRFWRRRFACVTGIPMDAS